MESETRYADSGGVNIAYQTLGKGPLDLVFVHGWASNIEVYQEEPAFMRFVSRLTSFEAPNERDPNKACGGPGCTCRRNTAVWRALTRIVHSRLFGVCAPI